MIDLNNIYVHGRAHFDTAIHIYNTASGIEFNANCSNIILKMKTISKQQNRAWMKVIIDNDYVHTLEVKTFDKVKEYLIFKSLKKEEHNFKILKTSEAIESYVDIIDLVIDGSFLDKPIYDKTFLVFGDSTVSAFGNLGHLGEEKSLFDTDGLNGFAYLCAKEFNATMNSLNGSGWGLVFSPWTKPFRRPLLELFDKSAPLSGKPIDVGLIKPNIVIISLGVNDALFINSGIEDKAKIELIKEFKDGYKKLLQLINNNYKDVPIVLVYGVMRETYNYELMHEIYLENKTDFNLYEAFLLGDGKGITSHPSKDSHKEMSLKLIEIIKEILGKKDECN